MIRGVSFGNFSRAHCQTTSSSCWVIDRRIAKLPERAHEDAPKTMRVTYRVGLNDYQSEWVCPEHDGWARQKFDEWWRRRSNDSPPATAERAVDIAEAGGLATTHKITVRKVTGEPFDRIVDYELGEKPEPVAFEVAMGYDESEIPF